MNYEKLEQLMAIPKKSDASKTTRKEYKNEIVALLKEESFSENAEKYLWGGFSFCGAEPLFDYINFQSNEEQLKLIESLLSCNTYSKNEKSNGFKMCLSLLAYEIEYCPQNIEIIGMLIEACVGKYKKKDGSISKDNAKIIEKYFVLKFSPKTKLINLTTLTIKPLIIQEFCKYIIESCSSITGKKSAKQVEVVTIWLETCLSQSTNESQNEPKTNVDDSLTKSASPLSNETTISSANSSLFGMVAQLKDLSARLFSYAEEAEKEKRTNQLLKAENKETVSKLKLAENTISDLKNQLLETKSNLETQTKQKIELITEIEKLKTVISVYSEDKQSSMDGQLNAIASKLKTEYSEFKDALELEMTPEIGEILRDQLMRVFKILSKAGVDIESR